MAKFIMGKDIHLPKLRNTEDRRLTQILGHGKTALRKIGVSGNEKDPLLTQKNPTCAYIRQKPC